MNTRKFYYKLSTGKDQETEQHFAWIMVVTARGVELPDHKLSWVETGTSKDTLDKMLGEAIKEMEYLNIKNYHEENKTIRSLGKGANKELMSSSLKYLFDNFKGFLIYTGHGKSFVLDDESINKLKL